MRQHFIGRCRGDVTVQSDSQASRAQHAYGESSELHWHDAACSQALMGDGLLPGGDVEGAFLVKALDVLNLLLWYQFSSVCSMASYATSCT